MRDVVNFCLGSMQRVSIAMTVIALVAAGCADQPKKDATATPAPAPAAIAPPVTPPRPAEPELSPAQAKAQSQKLALEAVD